MEKEEKVKLLKQIQSGAISPDALLFAMRNNSFFVCEGRYFYNKKEYEPTYAQEMIKRYRIPLFEVEDMETMLKTLQLKDHEF